MALANIINGIKPMTQRPRATLIIVPPGLREQWWGELQKHLPDKYFRQCHRLDEIRRNMRLPQPDKENALIL
jgi:hypothetical protein